MFSHLKSFSPHNQQTAESFKQFLMVFSRVFLHQSRNHRFTAPKNITTRPEGILHQNGRKFTKFTQHHVNEGGGGNEDEARYNLATRVMANGVEVIVADGKSTFPGQSNFFRILTNSKNYNRPLTLAPSMLNNVMMLMTLGGKNPKVKVEKFLRKNFFFEHLNR
jgi:hypothetical protein